MLRKLLIISVSSIFVPFFAWGDLIELKNGDTISGNIRLVHDGNVLIKTDYAGIVTIDHNKIKTFSIDSLVKVKKNLYSPPQFADSIKLAEENKIILVNKDKTETVTIGKDLVILKKVIKKLTINDFMVNGSLNAGTYYNNTTTKIVQYNLDGNLVIKYDLWRNSLYASLFKAEENDVKSADYYTTQYEVDRFIIPSLYWQATTQYKNDKISSLQRKFTVGMGPGWQLWDDELSSLSLTGLINYQVLNYRTSNDISRPTASIKWNYFQFFLSKDFKFFTLGQIGRGFNNDITLDFSATAGISYKLTNWLSINTSFTKELNKTSDGNTERVSYNIGGGIVW